MFEGANMTENAKKPLNTSDFEKKVEIEASFLIHMDRMKEPEAFAKARREVEKRFVVKDD